MATTPSKVEQIRGFLPKAAVADAAHDFQGTRAKVDGQQTGNIFSAIFKKYKGVGIPFKEEELLDEWDIVDRMVGIFDPNTPADRKVEIFKQKFLKGPNPTHIKDFYRWAEDTKPYKVTAIKVAEKSGGNYNWLHSSTDLFDLLSNKEPNLYFTIDACSVPFYDCLQKDDATPQNPAGSKNAVCIYTREGLNDAAGKKTFDSMPKKIVQFSEINDTANYNVLYPHIDDKITNEQINALTEQECFLSNYNLILSSIDQDKHSLTLSITNKDISKQVQITKHDKEDAHPNSVPHLAKKIYQLISKLFEKTNLAERMTYHSYLQQKRAGDWLQCLACTNPARFGLDTNTRIKLVTLDKICLAYALFCGLDVIFTYKNGKDRWVITFYKEAVAPTKEKILESEINSFARPEEIKTYDNNAEKLGSYSDYVNLYNQKRELNEQPLIDNFNKTHDEFIINSGGRFKDKDFQEKLGNFLKAAMALGAYRAIASKLNSVDPTPIYAQSESTFEDPSIYEETRNIFTKYKNDYNVMKNALTSRQRKSDVLGAEGQLNSYFSTVQKSNNKGTDADMKRGELVDRLEIFGSLFRKANGGENGVGIFEFLNNTMTNEEKVKITAKLQNVATNIPDEKKIKQYNIFINTIAFTLDIVEEDNTENKNKDLISIINEIDGEKLEKEEFTVAIPEIPVEEEAPAAKVNTSPTTQPSNAFKVTDFGAAMKMFRRRVQIGEFTMMLRRRLKPEKYKGGGSTTLPNSFHNPLTSLFFLLRELSFRLSYEDDEDDNNHYKHYIQIIDTVFRKEEEYVKSTLATLQDAALIPIIKYYYYAGFEKYFLDLAQFDSKFPILSEITRDIALTIKKGYYDITHLTSPENRILSDAFVKYLLTAPFIESTNEYYINVAFVWKNKIPDLMNAMEAELNNQKILQVMQNSTPQIPSLKPLIPITPREEIAAYGGAKRRTRKQRVNKILKKNFRKTKKQPRKTDKKVRFRRTRK